MITTLPYLMIVDSILVFSIFILFYRIKAILRQHNYEVTYLYGHLFDLILIIKLSIRSKKYSYAVLVLSTLILMSGFLYVSLLLIST